jgi:hypothetical protein
MSGFASDRPNGERSRVIATTGQIIKINTSDKTLTVSGPASAAGNNLLPRQRSWRLGVQVSGIFIPGRLTIPLPQAKSPSNLERQDEYTVLTTTDTVFQDGADDIRFEDFKSGETISIHGALKGTTLTAARLAKWN